MNPRCHAYSVFPVVGLLLFLGVPASRTSAAPRDLLLKDLGTLDGHPTVARALNDRGSVVGTVVIAPDAIRAFLWESGTMIDLGYDNMTAADINNRGQILLQQLLASPGDTNSCFLRDGTTTIELGHLEGGTTCFASDLNNRGQAVGTIGMSGPGHPSASQSRAFLWESGTMIDLGSLGGGYASALAINDRGQVVGFSSVNFGGPEHAFLWEEGVMTDLGAPAGYWSRAVAINDRGQVLLWSGGPPVVGGIGEVHLWEAGSTTALGLLGGIEVYPNDLNERGQVLAVIRDSPDFTSSRCVIWKAGALSVLPVPPGSRGWAQRLNNRGDAAGATNAPSEGSHAVIWTATGSPGRGDR